VNKKELDLGKEKSHRLTDSGRTLSKSINL
jgi:hypothetical protein